MKVTKGCGIAAAWTSTQVTGLLGAQVPPHPHLGQMTSMHKAAYKTQAQVTTGRGSAHAEQRQAQHAGGNDQL